MVMLGWTSQNADQHDNGQGCSFFPLLFSSDLEKLERLAALRAGWALVEQVLSSLCCAG